MMKENHSQCQPSYNANVVVPHSPMALDMSYPTVQPLQTPVEHRHTT